MKVLITGDSHTGPLYRGKELLASQGEWPQEIDLTIQGLGSAKFFSVPFFINKGTCAEFYIPEHINKFKYFPPLVHKNSNVIYGLCAILHPEGLRSHQDWTTFAPLQYLINETPISNALLQQAILDRAKYLLEFIDIILQAQKKVFVIEAPRPFRGHGALTVKLIRPEILSYVDRQYRDIIKQELRFRNVPVISVSSECYDEEGFMFDRYKSKQEKDWSHGNAEFGALMMKETLKFLNKQYA